MDQLYSAITHMLGFWGIDPIEVKYNAGRVYFEDRHTGKLYSLVPKFVPPESDRIFVSEPTADYHHTPEGDDT